MPFRLIAMEQKRIRFSWTEKVLVAFRVCGKTLFSKKKDHLIP